MISKNVSHDVESSEPQQWFVAQVCSFSSFVLMFFPIFFLARCVVPSPGGNRRSCRARTTADGGGSVGGCEEGRVDAGNKENSVFS